MSQMTTISQQKYLVTFAEDAAKWFSQNPEGATYSYETPSTGKCELLALRWGLGNDCVLVVKLDPDWAPVNFQNCIKKGGA